MIIRHLKNVIGNRIVLSIICTTILFSSCVRHKLEDFPTVTITNSIITAKVSTNPEKDDNFYQSSRFDYSGIVHDLRCGKHSYFGQWFDEINPKFHDNICGPVNEFVQVGYENTAVGDGFLKIGVGILKKENNSPYNFRHTYQIIDRGKWECSFDENTITYTQTLKSKLASYEYKKTIELVPNKPIMKIHHSLKNIGSSKIDTMVYCHNFFVIDNEVANEALSLKFAYNPKGCEILKDTKEFSEKIGDRIVLKAPIPEEKFVLYKNFDGENKIENYDFILENKKTGANVRITCDKPLLKVTFWSCTRTYCVEPFTKLTIQPNEDFHWTITYKFNAE